MKKLREVAYWRCREERIEPPSSGRIGRLIAPVARAHHERFCEEVCSRLAPGALRSMEALLETGAAETASEGGPTGARRWRLSWIKADPGRVGLESVLE